MSTVFAFEVCQCKYETGFKVVSLHSTEDQAITAMIEQQRADGFYAADGYRVKKWSVEV